MEKSFNKYEFNIQIFKSNLKELRMMTGASITEIANRCGFARESLYRWEDINDPRSPSIASLIILCNTYRISVESMLFAKGMNFTSHGDSPQIFNLNEEELDVNAKITSISPALARFFFEFKEALNSLIGEIDDVRIDKVDMVSPSYIAFKILKAHNSLGKPLHFLTIFPNLNRKYIRFVFSASWDEIDKKRSDKNSPLSESAFSLLSASPMGVNCSVASRTRLHQNENEFLVEMFIKEKPSLMLRIKDLVELSAKTLEIVISKKK